MLFRRAKSSDSAAQDEGLARAASDGAAFRPERVPIRTALLAAGVLVGLAVGTTWLLQRGADREARVHATARARAQAELVARATDGETGLSESARLMRILECTTRDGAVAAGVILDSTGRVLAHTDVGLLGMQVAAPFAEGGTPGPDVFAPLFKSRASDLILEPLIGESGPEGVVALLPADAHAGLISPAALRILLPAVLLLLAFVGVVPSTIRWAVRPTSEFLERLARTLEQEDQGARLRTARPREPDLTLDQAVRCVNALQQEKRTLLVQNRLLNYERKRLARILDRLPQGILLTDAVEKIVLSNRAAARWFAGAGGGDLSLDEVCRNAGPVLRPRERRRQ